MEITLRINGETKTFSTGFISGRMFRRAIAIEKLMKSGIVTEESLDEIIDYVVGVFDGKFSRDEFYDGVEADKLLPTVLETINQVVGKVSKVTGTGVDPNSPMKG
ncbi:hypothetical protein DFP93_102118 [Aneurinibacillus soli]|uniref:Uncharacterized protein n=1 Tax=Aneurinibacillus soli TaxID=1500254 RepID=A0A0U5AZC1_9BACL|nr:hypothetical protein [Aneurinibacillus soli]PYE63434.1 hypothetical protein DFP93_102118 [Aneurinibacillus soli]BAU27634.1 hypothetical protein CB4_01808 [Aneurinibacillus soli]